MLRSPDGNKRNVTARRSSDDISVRNCAVWFMTVLSTRDNGWLNRTGDIPSYLENCFQSCFNLWNNFIKTFKCSRNRMSLDDRSHPETVFPFFLFCVSVFLISKTVSHFQYVITLETQAYFFWIDLTCGRMFVFPVELLG